MTSFDPADDVVDAFQRATRALDSVRSRSDIDVTSIDPPTSLAPLAHALGADVDLPGRFVRARASARFLLLGNPSTPEAWSTPWRIVVFVKAPLEADVGVDPFMASVAWSWLTDSLRERGAEHTALAGTVTKTINTGFGLLSTETDGTELEIRASWSPLSLDDVLEHKRAWLDVVASAAGLPPVPSGVTMFPAGAGDHAD